MITILLLVIVLVLLFGSAAVKNAFGVILNSVLLVGLLLYALNTFGLSSGFIFKALFGGAFLVCVASFLYAIIEKLSSPNRTADEQLLMKTPSMKKGSALEFARMKQREIAERKLAESKHQKSQSGN